MTRQIGLRLRASILITFAVIVVWQVGTRGFAASLAVEAPQTALRLRSDEPAALVTLAATKLKLLKTDIGAQLTELSRLASKATTNLSFDRAEQPEETASLPHPSQPSNSGTEIDQTRAYAELALRSDPLNARALGILGQLAIRAGDSERAALLMQAAARLSHSESLAIHWMMRKKFEVKDYPAALYYADVFLRKRPQFIAHAMPVLARIAENTDTNSGGELKKLLASGPPWRSAFFDALPKTTSDVRTTLNFLLSVKNTPIPPTMGELGGYLRILVDYKYYELAYYAWLQFLPTERLKSVRRLVNSSFEADPSGHPFDWFISAGAGVSIDMAERPDQPGTRALYLRFGPGRVGHHGVSQIIMLPPGRYQFQAKYQGDLVGRRGLQWRISCAVDATRTIGESSMFLGSVTTWRKSEFTFTVPAADCRAQKLLLVLAARSESERLVSGAVWYDELAINRIEKSIQPHEVEGVPPGIHSRK